MTKKQKLELTWVGKENRPRLEPRILLEDPESSHHAVHRVRGADIFDNRLIFGDNLLALKALEQEFAGKVKCVFLDPRCNTGSMLEPHQDGLALSIWLSPLRDRLEIIRHLMAEDGSLWITTGSSEAHYLKVLCDEVFGRMHFVHHVIWQKTHRANNTYRGIASIGDEILVYGKSGSFSNRPLSRPGKGEAASHNWWPHTDVGGTDEAKKESTALFGAASVFPAAKPERLLHRILTLGTDPGDLVLDSFAGSGTTGAVAHKMGRRWIMVEQCEQAHTHVIPRLRKVIDGEDKGGISEALGWQGGGGFRYFRLAPPLLATDKRGRDVISKAYSAEMLAEALCKIEGFTYAPSDAVHWQHGHSTERDFIYVTTRTLGVAQFQRLSDEVGSERSLLVLCSAFRGNTDRWPNLTVRKIPNHVGTRSERGNDDYALDAANLPKAPAKQKPVAPSTAKSAVGQPDRFGAGSRGSR